MNRRHMVLSTFSAFAVMRTTRSTALAAQDATPPAADQANPFVTGTGLSLVPQGNPNTVEIVIKGQIVDGSVPFIVRNTTEFPVVIQDVIGTLRDNTGKLLDTISYTEVAPKNVLPNGIAFGSAAFSEDSVPLDAQVELAVKFEGGPDSNYLELPITEIEANSSGFVGGVTNNTAFPVESVQVIGVTLAPDGIPIGYFTGYVSDPIAPNEVGYFDGYLRGQPSQQYLVAAYSLNF